MLEAQLAQREATIESFVTAPPLAGEGKNQPNPHTSESDVSMLAERVSRNLQLEQEVILLAQKVIISNGLWSHSKFCIDLGGGCAA